MPLLVGIEEWSTRESLQVALPHPTIDLCKEEIAFHYINYSLEVSQYFFRLQLVLPCLLSFPSPP